MMYFSHACVCIIWRGKSTNFQETSILEFCKLDFQRVKWEMEKGKSIVNRVVIIA